MYPFSAGDKNDNNLRMYRTPNLPNSECWQAYKEQLSAYSIPTPRKFPYFDNAKYDISHAQVPI